MIPWIKEMVETLRNMANVSDVTHYECDKIVKHDALVIDTCNMQRGGQPVAIVISGSRLDLRELADYIDEYCLTDIGNVHSVIPSFNLRFEWVTKRSNFSYTDYRAVPITAISRLSNMVRTERRTMPNGSDMLIARQVDDGIEYNILKQTLPIDVSKEEYLNIYKTFKVEVQDELVRLEQYRLFRVLATLDRYVKRRVDGCDLASKYIANNALVWTVRDSTDTKYVYLMITKHSHELVLELGEGRITPGLVVLTLEQYRYIETLLATYIEG